MLQVPTYLDWTGTIPGTFGVVALAVYFVPLLHARKEKRLRGKGLFTDVRCWAFLRDLIIIESWFLAVLFVTAVILLNLKRYSPEMLLGLAACELAPCFALVAILGRGPGFDYLQLLIGGVWLVAFGLVVLERIGIDLWINLLWPLTIAALLGTSLYRVLVPASNEPDE